MQTENDSWQPVCQFVTRNWLLLPQKSPPDHKMSCLTHLGVHESIKLRTFYECLRLWDQWTFYGSQMGPKTRICGNTVCTRSQFHSLDQPLKRSVGQVMRLPSGR